MKNILIVDNEITTSQNLKRLLSKEGYSVYTAMSGKEGLHFLEKKRVDIVIAAHNMTEMKGDQFMSLVKKHYLETFRILMGTIQERTLMTDAISKNLAKIYILKPWDNNLVLEMISKICGTQDSTSDKNIVSIFKDSMAMPTIKSSYLELMEAIDHVGNMDDLVKRLEKDPAVTVKILKLANSAAFGLKTASIKTASLFLGIKNIKQLVLSTGIIDSLGGFGHDLAFYQKVWDHSYMTNKITNFIYERLLCKKVDDNCFAAGLLHNVGMILLIHAYKESYKNAIRKEDIRVPITHYEIEHFMIDHCSLGGMFLRWIDVPHAVVETALYHHDPQNVNLLNKEFVYVIHIAQYYAGEIQGMNKGVNLNESLFHILNIDRTRLENYCASLGYKSESMC